MPLKNVHKPAESIDLPDVDQLYLKVIQEDDYKGFELLFKHYYDPLCSYALRFVNTREAARDVVSEVFYRFWKNRATIDVQTSGRAYLFTAVKHQAYNYLSREFKRDYSIEEQFDLGSTEVYNPEEELLYNELNTQIEVAIDSLTPQCKAIFMLSRYEGLKYHEIAERLNISQKAVEAQITRALKLLRPLVRVTVLIFLLKGL